MALVSSIQARGHSGGTKRNGPLAGCHKKKADNSFHCHSKSIFKGRKWSSEEEATLEISGGKSMPIPTSKSYSRKDWGGWRDLDGDCLDTRQEVLKRDGRKPARVEDCRVVSGNWEDFYFGDKLESPSEIHIDHVVPVSHAHKMGGASWDPKKKRQFFNDEANLVIAASAVNLSKGAKDISVWQPREKTRACAQARIWRAVKRKYDLRFSKAEIDSLNLLKDCL